LKASKQVNNEYLMKSKEKDTKEKYNRRERTW